MSNFFPVLYIGRLIRYITGRTKGIKSVRSFCSPLLCISAAFVMFYHLSQQQKPLSIWINTHIYMQAQGERRH